MAELEETPRVEFYTKYEKEADKFDRDLLKKLDDDLATTLIFAGLFSAVTASFIIDVQSELKPDYNQITATLLGVLIQKVDNSTVLPGVLDLSSLEWTGPSSIIVAVQSLLYASLAASLISAFVAMLGKQWLNRYSQVQSRGSLIDRCHARQQKLNGLEQWHFHTVMESLPFMLQAALLLMGCALSRYLWDVQHTVTAVIICATSLGVLFYVFIVIAAISSYHCPFQTPLSEILRDWITRINQQTWFKTRVLQFRELNAVMVEGFFPQTLDSSEKAALVTRPLYSEEEVDLGGYSLDAECVSWILNEYTDSELIMYAIRMIPEVQWYQSFTILSHMERLSIILQKCFDFTSDVIPTLNEGHTPRETAFAASKALIHLFVQVPSAGNLELGLTRFRTEHPEIEYFVKMLSDTSGWRGDYFPFNFHPESWKIDEEDLPWLCHILVCALWKYGDVDEGPHRLEHFAPFITSCLSITPYPPNSITADCLLMISLMIGIPLHIRDVHVVDKSQKSGAISQRLYSQLRVAFERGSPEAARSSAAALQILASWRSEFGSETYWQKQRWVSQLFDMAMRSNTEPAVKWGTASLALQLAYRDSSLSDRPYHYYGTQCRDSILRFLEHRLFPVSGDGETRDTDESIADAFEGLWLVEIGEGWAPNLIQDSLLHSVCLSLDSQKPLRLRRSAMLVLNRAMSWWETYRIGTSWSEDQRRGLLTNLRALWNDLAVEEDKRHFARLFVSLVHSPDWHMYIWPDVWGPLEEFLGSQGEAEPSFYPLLAYLLVLIGWDRRLFEENARAERAWSLVNGFGWDPVIIEKMIGCTRRLLAEKSPDNKVQYVHLVDRATTEIRRTLHEYDTSQEATPVMERRRQRTLDSIQLLDDFYDALRSSQASN